MISIETSRKNYMDCIEIVVDEDGVKDLMSILSFLPSSGGVRYIEIATQEFGPVLHFYFESKAVREARAKQVAEDRAKYTSDKTTNTVDG